MFGHSYFGARYFGPHWFGPAIASGALRHLTVEGVDTDIALLPAGVPVSFNRAIDPDYVAPHDATRHLTVHGVEED